MARLSIRAPLFPTGVDNPLTVSGLRRDQRVTPGNVGVCLCGGGSRAMVAGMGQLRALAHLQANGKSLLSQVKALSTVSGGSWVGATFVYLTGETSDQDYLGEYVADPGRLVRGRTKGHSDAETLDILAPGNIARVAANRSFGAVGLAWQALFQHGIFKVPVRMTWPVLVGRHILQPYGLYKPMRRHRMLPQSLFSHDRDTLERDVVAHNPKLRKRTAHLYADVDDPQRIPRPYLICNMGMFLRQEGSKFQPVAPMQSTPYFTGVIGTPDGVDSNGLRPGGGGVASFAFGTEPSQQRGDWADAELERPWSLADAIGASSVFYAEALQNHFAEMRDDHDAFTRLMDEGEATQDAWLDSVWESQDEGKPTPIERLFAHGAKQQLDTGKIPAVLAEIQELIPEARCWPVREGELPESFAKTRLSDGGTVENTGICGLLAYQDIDNVIAFVNSAKPMAQAEFGVLDEHGRLVPDSNIFIERQMPPLFGYQPYQDGLGYELYAGDDDPVDPEFGHSQVFESAGFPRLLQALWRASGNHDNPGANLRPAIARLTLRVLPNAWFGIPGRGHVGDDNPRGITLVLVYTMRVRTWFDQLQPGLQKMLGDFDDPESFHDFPHYSTFDTHLEEHESNILAHFTAWTVANQASAPLFTELFQDRSGDDA